MENNVKQCTGDCLKCSFQQQVYCTSQRTYALLKNQEAIVEMLGKVLSAVSADTLINPFGVEEAQEGRGADNSSPIDEKPLN